jgi:hypothetical protein
VILNNGSITFNPIEPCPTCSLSLSDDTINIGESITATVSTDFSHNFLAYVKLKWIDPTNTVRRDTAYNTTLQDSFIPDMVGQWTVVIECFGEDVLIQTFDVGFMVLPESTIGAVAIVGASVAVLIVYIYRNKT